MTVRSTLVAVGGAEVDTGYRAPMGAGPGAGYGAPPIISEQSTSLVKVVHRLLRGRYVITVTLALVMAVLGAMAGWTSTVPKFKTQGLVQIRSYVDPTLSAVPGTGAMPYVHEFVQAQSLLFRNQRIVDRVMSTTGWRELKLDASPTTSELVKDTLEVSVSPQSREIITVECVHPERQFTRVVVEEAIRAYMLIYSSASGIPESMVQTLRQEDEAIVARIRALEQRIADEASEFGSDNLQKEIESKQEMKIRLAEDIERYKIQRTMMESRPSTGGGADQPLPKTPREIAVYDPKMREKLQRLDDAESHLEKLRRAQYGEESVPMRNARRAAIAAQAEVDEYASKWQERRIPTPAGTSVAGPTTGTETLEEIDVKLAGLERRHEALLGELRALTAKNHEIAALKRDLRQQEQQMASIRERLESFRIEGRSLAADKDANRINVISYGETPLSPTVDKRKQLAAAGFVLGGGIPVALMLLIGLVDRRLRYSDDTTEPTTGFHAPLLGILPVLPKDLDDDDQRATAAHCVHQIRLLLQLTATQTGARVFAVTSPTAGDGKTSLTLALGMSFAASGSRTLMIDFDTVGTGLSSSLDIRGVPGVVDAIRSGDVGASTHPTQVERLWLMPSTPGDDVHVARFSASGVGRFIEQVRDQYDVVLVDTGPILGSLEAALVGSRADAMVLVVGRGQHHGYVKRAIDQINAVGGRLVGLVFNRASGGDFRRSVSAASFRSVGRALPSSRTDNLPVVRKNLGKAGTIASAVAVDIQPEQCAWRDENGTDRSAKH